MVRPRIAFGSIVKISNQLANFGNGLIEYALRKSLIEPDFEFNLLDPISDKLLQKLKMFDFVINPGATHLTPQETQSVKQLYKLGSKLVVTGASIWNKYPADLSLARSCYQPVGVRDPHTHKLLVNAKIPSSFVGCPVLLLDYADAQKEDKKLVFSFSRHDVPAQIEVIKKLAEKFKVTIVCHESCELLYNVPEGIRVASGEDPETIIHEYSTASLAITGRLHGALPAAISNTPLIYFDTFKDSRSTLLSFLGIQVVKLNEINSRDYSKVDQNKLNQLRKHFLDYLALLEVKK